MKERISKEGRAFKAEFFKTVSTMVVAAFSLVAALAWNNAITETLQRYLNPGSRILSWFLYAVIVTLIAVLVTYYVGRISAKFTNEEK